MLLPNGVRSVIIKVNFALTEGSYCITDWKLSKFVLVFELRIKSSPLFSVIQKEKHCQIVIENPGFKRNVAFSILATFSLHFLKKSSNFCDFFQDMSLMMFNSATLRSGYLLKDTTEFALQLEHMMRDTLGVDRYLFIFFHFFIFTLKKGSFGINLESFRTFRILLFHIKMAQINYDSRNQLLCTANLNFGLMCKKAKLC